MDSYSGSCPQQFISFRLDMTTEKNSPELTTAPVVEAKETETPETVELLGLDRPSPQASEGSRSTEESVSTYIERTVDVMSQPDTETINPLPTQQGSTARMVTVSSSFLKVSVSEPITVRNDLTHIEAGTDNYMEDGSTIGAPGLYGDTTEAEDLQTVPVWPPSHQQLLMSSLSRHRFLSLKESFMQIRGTVTLNKSNIGLNWTEPTDNSQPRANW